MAESYINKHIFHGLYSNDYIYDLGPYYKKNKTFFNDLVFLGATEEKGLRQTASLNNKKLFLNFQNQNDAFIWYKKTLLGKKYNEYNLIKNYILVNEQDISKYSCLFNNMIKSVKITAYFSNTKEQDSVNYYYDETDPENVIVRSKKTFYKESSFTNHSFDTSYLLGDTNLQDRFNLVQMSYNGGVILDKTVDELYLGSQSYGISSDTRVYGDNWSFQSNILKSTFGSSFNRFPHDRTRFNNPVIPSNLTDGYISLSGPFGLNSTLSVGKNSDQQQDSVSFSSNNAGDPSAGVTASTTDDESTVGSIGVRTVLTANMSAVLYIEATKQYMIFFEVYLNTYGSNYLFTYGASTNERLVKGGDEFLAQVIANLNSDGNYDPRYIFDTYQTEIQNITLKINNIEHSIPIICRSPQIVRQAEDTNFESLPDDSKIGFWYPKRRFQVSLSNFGIYINGWKKEDFSEKVVFPPKVI